MSRFFLFVGVVVVSAALFVFLAMRGGGPASSANKVLHLAIDTDPKTLDPIAVTDTISDGLARKVHNTLVRFNAKLEIVPDLADHYEISPDGKLYTFWLRKGVKFHDGREMKSADAVHSLMRLLAPESKRREWLEPMVVGSTAYTKDASAPVGIKASDEYTFTIELYAPFAPFIQHLCTVNCAIVSKAAAEDISKPFSRNPVGAGPFKLAEWRTGEVVTFARNDSYYLGKPKLDAIHFHIIKDPNTRLEQFLNGDLDASDIPFGRMKEAIEKAGEENSFAYATYRTNYLGFGMPNGKFTDKADLQPFGTNKLLRQAISYALDREYLCDKVLEGRGIPAIGVLPPGLFGCKADRPVLSKDIEKAKSLLAQAGFPNGQGLPVLTILHRNDLNTRMTAQVVAEDLQKIGINVELQARDWNAFTGAVEIEPKQAFLLGWVADYNDPDNFLYVLFNTAQWGAPGNHTWFSNPKVDELTEKARNLTDMKDRIPLYHQAEDIILDECPWICTYHARNVILLRKNVTGIREKATPLDTGTEFPQVDFGFVDKE